MVCFFLTFEIHVKFNDNDHVKTKRNTKQTKHFEQPLPLAPALIMLLSLMDRTSTPRLSYLDVRSIAEPIRLALHIGGVPFEDRRVSYEEIAAMREAGELPCGQVPILEVNGVVYCQTQAVSRRPIKLNLTLVVLGATVGR